MKDQFALFYVKDGIMYPCALKEEQLQMLELMLSALGKITVVGNLPQGEAVNLLNKDTA